MRPDRLENLLEGMFGTKYPVYNSQFRIDCVFCRDYTGNLEINLGSGIWHCWKCDASGTLLKLLKALGKNFTGEFGDEYVSAEELKKFQIDFQPGIREQKKFSGLPVEFCPLWDRDRKLSMVGQQALNYALSRMSLEDISTYKIGYCGLGKYKWRIIIPFFEGGNVVYFLGRGMYKNMVPPYLNSDSPKRDVIFNYEKALKIGRVALVEGVFDAIKIGDGFPIVGLAILGTSLTEEQIFKLNQIDDLTIMLDNDAKLKTYKIVNILKGLRKKPKVVILSDSRDPDEYSRSELHKMLLEAKVPTFEDELLLRMND